MGTQNKDFEAVLPMDSATGLVCGEATFNLSFKSKLTENTAKKALTYTSILCKLRASLVYIAANKEVQ